MADWTRRGLGHRGRRPGAPALPSLAERLDARRLALPAPASTISDNSRSTVVLDQGASEACLEHAAVQEHRVTRIVQGNAHPRWASKRLLWQQCRQYEGTWPQNVGSYSDTLIDAAQLLGFAAEDEWPWAASDFATAAPRELDRDEFDQRNPDAADWAAIDVLADVTRILSAGYVVRIAAEVSEEFCDNTLDWTRPVDLMDTNIAGSHAMCVIGFDGTNFDVLNSWGADWGNAGRCKVTPQFVEAAHERVAMVYAHDFGDTLWALVSP
jgi:hypothetical protein